MDFSVSMNDIMTQVIKEGVTDNFNIQAIIGVLAAVVGAGPA